MMKIVAASSLAFALSGPAIAHAAGGVPLLDLTLHGQLERWQGAGPLQLDNIYTRQAGDDSLDFHAAADNKGDTFTLLRLTTPEGASYLVGGYNPQTWSSTDGWHVTERDPERTAFIFNYTAPAVYRQVPTTYILPSQGARQTFNAPDHAPPSAPARTCSSAAASIPPFPGRSAMAIRRIRARASSTARSAAGSCTSMRWNCTRSRSFPSRPRRACWPPAWACSLWRAGAGPSDRRCLRQGKP